MDDWHHRICKAGPVLRRDAEIIFKVLQESRPGDNEIFFEQVFAEWSLNMVKWRLRYYVIVLH